MDTDRKNQRTTAEQLRFYLNFCQEHREMQSGKNNPSAPRQVQNLWDELAEKLNAMRGPTRTPQKWKESLNQWKHKVRSRARQAKVYQRTTGGGPFAKALELSEMEEMALHTFGAMAVNGNENVAAMGFEDPLCNSSGDGDTLLPEEDAETEASLVNESINSTTVENDNVLPEESTSSSVSYAGKRMSPHFFYEELQKMISKREAREERLLREQIETNATLKQMGEALLVMAEALLVL